MVLYGLCAKTPALLDEVVKTFLDAQIEHPGAGDCAKGAALLLAGSRGLLSALPVSSRRVHDCPRSADVFVFLFVFEVPYTSSASFVQPAEEHF